MASTTQILAIIICLAYCLILIPVYLSNWVILGSYQDQGIIFPVYGPGFAWYSVLAALCLLLGNLVLAHRLNYLRTKKEQLFVAYFILGYLITIGGIVVTNIVFPIVLNNMQASLYAPLSSLIWIGVLLVGLIQRKIIDPTVFIPQLLIVIAIIIILVITINNSSRLVALFDLIFLGIFSIFGLLIIANLQKSAHFKKLLHKKNQKLQKFIKIKDDFLKMVTHQLRAPITVLDEYTDMALEQFRAGNASQEYDYLTKISINNHSLKGVVEEFNLFYMIRVKTFALRTVQQVDVQAIIQALIEEIKLKGNRSHIDIRYLQMTNHLYLSQADPYFLEFALRKVIQNAYIFAKEAVEVKLSYQGKTLLIAIRDDGMGIAAEDLPKLFRPFYRSLESVVYNPDGSGLGLYLAKNILGRHRGKIVVTSQGHNLGSQVYIYLPNLDI